MGFRPGSIFRVHDCNIIPELDYNTLVSYLIFAIDIYRTELLHNQFANNMYIEKYLGLRGLLIDLHNGQLCLEPWLLLGLRVAVMRTIPREGSGLIIVIKYCTLGRRVNKIERKYLSY
jgi:hypothetical protein